MKHSVNSLPGSGYHYDGGSIGPYRYTCCNCGGRFMILSENPLTKEHNVCPECRHVNKNVDPKAKIKVQN